MLALSLRRMAKCRSRSVTSLMVGVLVAVVGGGSLSAQSLPIVYQFGLPAGEVLVDARPSGDQDADGVEDFALVTRRDLRNAGGVLTSVQNRVEIRSGVSGTPLVSVGPFFVGPEDLGDVLVMPIGDVDGDGVADIAVANDFEPTAGISGSAGRSEVLLFSGFDGSLIRQFLPAAGMTPGYGAELKSGVDVDGDGVQDLLIGQRLASNAGARAEVRSGATGVVLTVCNFGSGDFMSLEWGEDGDLDGVPEILMSIDNPPVSNGRIHIFSGATGQRYGSVDGAIPGDRFGVRLTRLDDIDGDGQRDLLVHSDDRNGMLTGFGDLTAINASGDRLHSSSVVGNGRLLQDRPLAVGDVDGDGFVDFSGRYEVYFSVPETFGEFARRLYSGFDGEAIADLPIRSSIVGDLNGDGSAEFLWYDFDAPAGQSGLVTVESFVSAQPYGVGLGGLTLRWDPRPGSPARGDFVFEGAAPGDELVFAVSLAPTDEILQPEGLPLFVSLDSQSLLFTEPLLTDGSGRARLYSNLTRPEVAGLLVYLQAGRLGASPAASNGLEVLLGR